MEKMQENTVTERYIKALEIASEEAQKYIGGLKKRSEADQNYIKALEKSCAAKQDRIVALVNAYEARQNYIELLEHGVEVDRKYIGALEEKITTERAHREVHPVTDERRTNSDARIIGEELSARVFKIFESYKAAGEEFAKAYDLNVSTATHWLNSTCYAPSISQSKYQKNKGEKLKRLGMLYEFLGVEEDHYIVHLAREINPGFQYPLSRGNIGCQVQVTLSGDYHLTPQQLGCLERIAACYATQN